MIPLLGDHELQMFWIRAKWNKQNFEYTSDFTISKVQQLFCHMKGYKVGSILVNNRFVDCNLIRYVVTDILNDGPCQYHTT
jgi:hypothetical protein